MSMKWEKTAFKGELARARGLGSARGETVASWIALRASALAAAILSVWFIIFVKSAVGLSHQEFVLLLSQPVNAVGMLAFIGFVFYHAMLGNREVIEDYCHEEGPKLFKIYAQKFVLLLLATACVYSVLKITLMPLSIIASVGVGG